jgi:hypothetical protein
MSSKALFFNALPDENNETGYDRNYNADDLSDFLSIVCDTGVVKTNTVGAEAQGLKVVAASGMTVNVNAGKAVIKGKAFINDALESFTVTANGTAANRYDLVILKFDNNISARNITIEVRTGTSSIPTVANLTRTDKIYELMLAYITVAPSVTSLAQTNITDTRGNAELCPWFTAVKGYDGYYDAIIQAHESTVTLPSITNVVITDLPSKLYNERYSLIEVYTNGIKEPEGAFTASVSGGYIVITFTAQKAAQTKITVILNNFIDGEGMTTALAQYNKLLQDVADIKAAGEYNYICNGVNDNVLIGDIVRAYLSAGTDYGSMKLNIIGNIGMTVPAKGTGATTNPYAWFNFAVESNRNIIVDFTRCGQIAPTIINGSYNLIFDTINAHIIGATVIASNTEVDTNIRIHGGASGAIKFENCRFYITAYKNGLIALRGTFTNCRGSVANITENSYCFLPSSYGVVKIIGGEYYAYTGDANKQSAIIGQSGADAVSILYGVSAPTSARTGFYQTNSILQWAGGGILSCTDLISALPMIVVSGISNIRGTIAKSKTYVW